MENNQNESNGSGAGPLNEGRTIPLIKPQREYIERGMTIPLPTPSPSPRQDPKPEPNPNPTPPKPDGK